MSNRGPIKGIRLSNFRQSKGRGVKLLEWGGLEFLSTMVGDGNRIGCMDGSGVKTEVIISLWSARGEGVLEWRFGGQGH